MVHRKGSIHYSCANALHPAQAIQWDKCNLKSESKVLSCVIAKSRIIHMSAQEHHPSLPHSKTYLCSARFIVVSHINMTVT